jgi:hypothetical protein
VLSSDKLVEFEEVNTHALGLESAPHTCVTPRVRRRVKVSAKRFAKDVYIACKVFIIISF